MFGKPSGKDPKTADEVANVDFLFDASGKIIGTVDPKVLQTQAGFGELSGIQVMDALGNWTYTDTTKVSVN